MITMVFEKALSRKAFGNEEDVETTSASNTGVNRANDSLVQPTPGTIMGVLLRIRSFLKLEKFQNLLSVSSVAPRKRARASMGKILNLLRYVPSVRYDHSKLT